MRWLALIAFAAHPAFAEGEKAGQFDYYVMSLSWSAAWCAIEGDAKGADQCDPRHDFSFTLHGLWPQYEVGWPSYCSTTQSAPSRTSTAAMADIMGSGGLAWYEWKKHGVCSGLSASDYYGLSRRAFTRVKIPDVLKNVKRPLRLAPRVVEDAFLESNPGLKGTEITVLCDQDRISEVRLCMTKDLQFRDCGIDTARDCRMQGAVLEPVR